jgi:hypothetical protein
VDRLDHKPVTVIVDELDHRGSRALSSRVKNEDASIRIRSPVELLHLGFDGFVFAASAVVTPAISLEPIYA